MTPVHHRRPRSPARLRRLFLPMLWCALLAPLVCGCPGPGREDLEALVRWSPSEMGEIEPQIRRQLDRAVGHVRSLLDRKADGRELAAGVGRLAMLHHVYRNVDRAVAAYEAAERLDRSDPRWPYYRGQLLVSRGDLEGAVAAFERSLTLVEDPLPIRVRLAETQLRSGLPEEAWKHFESLLAAASPSARVLTGAAEVEAARGDAESAMALFRRALEKLPAAPRIRLGLGRALREAGQLDEARKMLERIDPATAAGNELDLVDPMMVELHRLDRGSERRWQVGRSYLAAGRAEEAIVLLRQALELAPHRLPYLTDLGHALAYRGDWDAALGQYRSALSRDPAYLPALVGLARAQTRVGRTAEAIATYRRLLELDEGHAEIHADLGDLHRVEGQPGEAIEHYRRAIELDPPPLSAYVWLGWLEFLEGDSERSLATFRDGLERHPESEWLAALELRILVSLQDREGAAGLIQVAREQLRRVPMAFNAETLAMLHARAGDFVAARAWQSAALAAAENAGADRSVMEARMDDYRRARRARVVLDRSDPAAADMPLRRSDVDGL